MIARLRTLLARSFASEQGSTALAGPAIEIGPRQLTVDDTYSQTLIVTGYPRDVTPGWAMALLAYPGRIDVALHIEPVDSALASTQLRKRRARLESSWRLDAYQGRVEDPHRAAAVEDAADLAQRVATAQARLFKLAVYVTVHASTEADLAAEVEHVRTLASSMMIDTVPATFRALEGWIATLPLGTDPVRVRRTMDTDAIATMMPIASPDLVADLGASAVVYGENTHSAGLVMWDRFNGDLDNHNAVILARSGAGKSYLAKLEILRLLLVGVEIAIIDPDDEYARLAQAVGGTCIPLGTPHGRINPFDLAHGDDALTTRALFLHTLVATMVGELSAEETAALDRAIIATYAAAGITTDDRTWHRDAPHMANLLETLTAAEDPAATSLVTRLQPYVHGSHARLFDGPTSAGMGSHLTVISLRDVPDELKTVGILLALDALWRTVTNPHDRRPRMIAVDEAWAVLQSDVGARYLYRLAKSLRKHWAGLTVITQDVGDVLSTDLGRAVVSNAATQILLKQGPQNLDAAAEAFGLSEGERQVVATAQRGEALLVSGHQRVGFRALASPEEHRLITTNPAELAEDSEVGE
ncbi:type IV secretory pathway VirB4 component [Lipingzhangella halophila]|uniref:Type IV secretory pathway VirB4 component n=1 Tax=Lipingzhangella halophila TaxID=1783352 RepID=A0A7W7W4Q4_9ACTN|nr:ATP-binding protein [Lipingzhangella halophila]MBB4934422.1 type IV secretory pathway VirB4 component [Lipingzhangella halophila]